MPPLHGCMLDTASKTSLQVHLLCIRLDGYQACRTSATNLRTWRPCSQHTAEERGNALLPCLSIRNMKHYAAQPSELEFGAFLTSACLGITGTIFRTCCGGSPNLARCFPKHQHTELRQPPHAVEAVAVCSITVGPAGGEKGRKVDVICAYVARWPVPKFPNVHGQNMQTAVHFLLVEAI